MLHGYPRVLVRDLMDLVNEFRRLPALGDNFIQADCDVDDRVEAITLEQIFNSLIGVTALTTNSALDKWRDNLKEVKPSQSSNLDHYFLQWEK